MQNKYFSDFDGTIFKKHDTEYYIDQIDIDCLKKIDRDDFIIVSGKFFHEITEIITEKELTFTYMICNNGATIWKNNHCIHWDELDQNILSEFLTSNEGKYSAAVFYSHSNAFVTSSDLQVVAKLMPEIRNLSIIEDNAVSDLKNIVSIGLLEPRDIVCPSDFIAHSSYHDKDYLDFTNKKINKANAINKLCELENLNNINKISFGDSDNDISMFEICQQSYAMFNASKNLKKLATKIITNVSEIICLPETPINNFHIHTFRCGHSNIREELLIQLAIKNKYSEINFSEHLSFPNEKFNDNKIPFDKIEEYLTIMNELKTKYSKKIKINVGFETEFHEEYVNYYKEMRSRNDVDFISLAFHEFIFDGTIVPWNTSFEKIDYDYIIKYYKNALKIDVFDYIVHPDIIFAFNEFTKESKEFTKKFINLVIKENIPIEFNSYGIRERGRPYQTPDSWIGQPCLPFWEVIQNAGYKNVVFGGDTHQIGEFDGWADKITYSIYQDFLQDKELVNSFKENIPFLNTYFSDVKKWK